MSANIHHANQKMMSLTANSSDHVLMAGARPGIARFAFIKQNLIHKPAARLPVSESENRYRDPMPTQRNWGGRKSKGDRQALISRIPDPIADAVRERADERGMSLSDYIASVLAREVGMSDLAPESAVHHQEELPISQVA